MKRKTKASLLKGLFTVITLFVIMVVAIPLIKTNEESAKWVVDFVKFFTDVKTNIVDNAGFYAILAGLTGGLYYFLVYRPKFSK